MVINRSYVRVALMTFVLVELAAVSSPFCRLVAATQTSDENGQGVSDRHELLGGGGGDSSSTNHHACPSASTESALTNGGLCDKNINNENEKAKESSSRPPSFSHQPAKRILVLEGIRIRSEHASQMTKRLTEVPFPSDAHLLKNERKTERFVFEVLVDGLETRDGDNVVVHRYLGGNEQIADSSSNIALTEEAGRAFTSDLKRKKKNVAYYLTPLGEISEPFPSNTKLRKMMDPFLVLDAYRSNGDNPHEYSGGFPAHPHMGMLEIRHFTIGGLHHTDSCHRNRLTPPGGGQALFAGRGIIHEEKAVDLQPTHDAFNNGNEENGNNLLLSANNKRRKDCGVDKSTLAPQRVGPPHDGLTEIDGISNKSKGFKGFQVWINVPKLYKTKSPNYRSVASFPTIPITRAYPFKSKRTDRKGKYVQSNQWVKYEFAGDNHNNSDEPLENTDSGGGRGEIVRKDTNNEDSNTNNREVTISHKDPANLSGRYPPAYPSLIRVIAGHYDGVYGPFTDMIRGGAPEKKRPQSTSSSSFSSALPGVSGNNDADLPAIASELECGDKEKIGDKCTKNANGGARNVRIAQRALTVGNGNGHDDSPTYPPNITKETVKGFLYLDVTLRCDHPPLTLDLPNKQNALVYMYDHSLRQSSKEDDGREDLLPVGIGSSGNIPKTNLMNTDDKQGATTAVHGMVIGKLKSGNAAFVPINSLAILGDGDHVVVSCPAADASGASSISFIIITAPPVKEKVFIANGFAMSSEAELGKAIEDFENGKKTWC